jgi:hypothetical protein
MNDEQDNDIAEEVDEVPNWAKEADDDDELSVEGEDISKAEQREPFSDVIEPAKDVEVYIKSVRAEKFTPNGFTDWKLFNLEPMLVIGEKGIDGKGKYRNKHFFPRLLVAVNRNSEEYDFTTNAQGKPSDFYQPGGNAFGDYSAFLTALGLPNNPGPKNDAAFRKSLVGRKLRVDIVKDRRRVKDNATGKYSYVDEYENKLLYKPGKKEAATAPVESAAAAS